ncbi:hypothetical protein SAMN04488082_12230 [Desulfomicrobium apsheronum]|uniref:Uncharacterized protein n=1 Tax=Desulfomicrobium apsheronum TaxID=52560 RepID=A0A1I3Z3N0_9BACT|nr:hypothetical protein SAMN04488082_12230 [Desulfomicrobium apsheronum]
MTVLSPEPSIHPTASVVDSILGAWIETGAQTEIILMFCRHRADVRPSRS